MDKDFAIKRHFHRGPEFARTNSGPSFFSGGAICCEKKPGEQKRDKQPDFLFFTKMSHFVREYASGVAFHARRAF